MNHFTTLPALPADVLGQVVQILLPTRRNTFSLASVYAYLGPAIALDQIAFITGGRSQPLGYVAWAFVSPAVLAELAVDPTRTLDLPEWNEGTELVVMDAVLIGARPWMLRALLRERCPRHVEMWWRRHDRAGASSRLKCVRLRRPRGPK